MKLFHAYSISIDERGSIYLDVHRSLTWLRNAIFSDFSARWSPAISKFQNVQNECANRQQLRMTRVMSTVNHASNEKLKKSLCCSLSWPAFICANQRYRLYSCVAKIIFSYGIGYGKNVRSWGDLSDQEKCRCLLSITSDCMYSYDENHFWK